MKLIKKYWFILLLLILAIVLVLIKTKYSGVNIPNELKNNNTTIDQGGDQTEINENTSETTENIEETKEITITPELTGKNEETGKPTEYGDEYYFEGDLSDNMSDYKSGENLEIFLPYKGKYFTVKRYLSSGYLEVIVGNENDLPKAKEEVENWLKENNTNSQETQLLYVFK